MFRGCTSVRAAIPSTTVRREAYQQLELSRRRNVRNGRCFVRAVLGSRVVVEVLYKASNAHLSKRRRHRDLRFTSKSTAGLFLHCCRCASASLGTYSEWTVGMVPDRTQQPNTDAGLTRDQAPHGLFPVGGKLDGGDGIQYGGLAMGHDPKPRKRRTKDKMQNCINYLRLYCSARKKDR